MGLTPCLFMAIPPPSPSNLPPPPGSEENPVTAPVAAPKKFPVVPVAIGAVALLAVAVGVSVVMMRGKGGKETPATDASGVPDVAVAEVVAAKLDEARPDYGVSTKSAHGLVGTFYDFLHSPDGVTQSEDAFKDWTAVFEQGKADFKELAKTVQLAPKALVTARLQFATRKSKTVGSLFDAKSETGRWVAVYRGKVRAPFSGKFRFVGSSSSDSVVRFNDTSVFHARAKGSEVLYNYLKSDKWAGVPIVSGSWVTVEKGRDYPVEVALMHNGSHDARFFLMLQRQDKDYPKNEKGELILESFRVLDEPAPEGQYPQTTPGPVFPIVEN